MKVPEQEYEFTYSRSAGAGGQNINKVNTKVTLIWDIKTSTLSPSILRRFKSRYRQYITAEGLVKITSQKFRTQPRNRKDCIEKLETMLESVKKAPKRRIPTKPSRGAVESRIKEKKNKGDIKKTRKKVDY